jgi:hypothetical protein
MIQNAPFLPVRLQISNVGIDISQFQLPDTALDTLANLFANLAKTRPAHAQLRQKPLQKPDATAIVHKRIT